MKKITLLLLLTVFSFGQAQNGGDTCGSAVAIIGNTSFTNTTINTLVQGGEMGNTTYSAAWFAFTAPSDGTITVSSCSGSGDTYVFIGSGTCGSLTTIQFNDDCTTSYGSEISDLIVDSGVTYYIEWEKYWGSSPEVFDWSFAFTPSATCGEISGLSFTSIVDASVDFDIEVPISGGTPIQYNWQLVPSGNAPNTGIVTSGTTTSLSVNATGLTTNTSYDIYIETVCGAGSSMQNGPHNFTTALGTPPANDTCEGAILATQEISVPVVANATAHASTIENAYFTLDPSDCFGGGDTSDDVWFSFVAKTADVNITVDGEFDVALTLYETTDNTCETLNQIECTDDVLGTGEEEINTSGLSINDTYYFRVYQYSNVEPANGTFTYKLWSSSTLHTENVETVDDFKYYPNPVKNELSLKAKSVIQQITIYNMLGQQVLSTAPKTLESTVNMSTLNTGTYVVQVTINELTKTIRVIKQ